MIDLRSRKCLDVIDIGLFEIYSNSRENVVKPFDLNLPPMNSIPNIRDHAQLSETIIREHLPNAIIHLVPPTEEGIKYIMDNDIPLVNMSLSNTYVMSLEPELAKKAFLVTSAGNAGERGESMSARKEFWCAVGAVDENLNPQEYSSWGKGCIKTCAMTGHKEILGRLAHGTSFASPEVVGLLGQWFIWYKKITGKYPSKSQANNFIRVNSHDLLEDGKDLRTGYGLFRLPHVFELEVITIDNMRMSITKTKYVENESPVVKEIILSNPISTIGGKLNITTLDLSSIVDLNIIQNSDEQVTLIL